MLGNCLYFPFGVSLPGSMHREELSHVLYSLLLPYQGEPRVSPSAHSMEKAAEVKPWEVEVCE